MGWKSTKEVSREEAIEIIKYEISNIDRLNNETLAEILENLGDDISTDLFTGHNYIVNG